MNKKEALEAVSRLRDFLERMLGPDEVSLEQETAEWDAVFGLKDFETYVETYAKD